MRVPGGRSPGGCTEVAVADVVRFGFGVDGVLGGGLAVVAAGQVVDGALVAEEDARAEAGGAEPDVGFEVAVVAGCFVGDDDADDAGLGRGVFDGVEEVFEVVACAGGVALSAQAVVHENLVCGREE